MHTKSNRGREQAAGREARKEQKMKTWKVEILRRKNESDRWVAETVTVEAAKADTALRKAERKFVDWDGSLRPNRLVKIGGIELA